MIDFIAVSVSDLDSTFIFWESSVDNNHLMAEAVRLVPRGDLYVRGQYWGYDPTILNALVSYTKEVRDLTESLKGQMDLDKVQDLPEDSPFRQFIKLVNR